MQKKERGFTIIELLVGVVIIVLFATVSFIALSIARDRTRDAVIKTELEQLQGIAETVYHPEIGYKELWEMRGNPLDTEDDFDTLKQIRTRISDMGRKVDIWFPEDSIYGTEGFDEYCAMVLLFSKEDEIFCVDSTGFVGKVDVSDGPVECDSKNYRPYNCEKQ